MCCGSVHGTFIQGCAVASSISVTCAVKYLDGQPCPHHSSKFLQILIFLFKCEDVANHKVKHLIFCKDCVDVCVCYEERVYM